MPSHLALGVVQGLTEFLPVSSSAHLILARAFFGFDGDKFGLAFDVACHVGTLIAVLIYFRRDVARMLAALPRLFDASDPEARLIWLIVVGTIPAIVAGLLFKNQIEDHLRTPPVAAIALALGAVLFFVAERTGSKTRAERTLTMAEAFLIGCAQAVALVPGVSRSGATITVALLIGLRRAEAARFIFLLAIPAILGAAASEAPKLLKAGLGDTASLFLIGVVSSAIVGYAAVKLLHPLPREPFAGRVRVVPARAGRRRGLVWLFDAMMQWLRRSFIAGFFVTVPLFISVAAFIWIFGVVDGLTTPLYDRLLGRRIPGLGTVSTAARSCWSGRSRPTSSAGACCSAARVAAARAGVPDDLRAGQAAHRGVFAGQRVGVQARRDGRGRRARVRARVPDAGVHRRPRDAAPSRCWPSTCRPTTSIWATS